MQIKAPPKSEVGFKSQLGGREKQPTPQRISSCIHRGSCHINTKLSAQTLSYKMKNIRPRRRQRIISRHKSFCKSPMESSSDLQTPFCVWLRKTLRQLDCEATLSAAFEKRNPIPVSRSPTGGGEEYERLPQDAAAVTSSHFFCLLHAATDATGRVGCGA